MFTSSILSLFVAASSLTSHVTALKPIRPLPPSFTVDHWNWTTGHNTFNYTSGVPQMGNSTFQQLIDHKNPGLGTFSQFYFYSDQYYAGPGSPVILFTPGEAAAASYSGYLTNRTLMGIFAEAIGAAVIVLEHRYWGESSPYAELTTENLQYLTLENSIADLTNFARTAQLPFDKYRTSAAPKAPWLLSGGSYSGALTAWTASVAPGTFYAYTATSAVVETVYDFWTYFSPVIEGLPKNCTSDLEAVINHVDNILETGSATQVANLKNMFGLGALEHDDDFANSIENGPWEWQSLQFYGGDYIFDFCDAVEGVTHNSTVLPGPGGVGVEKALAGYATWFNTTYLPGACASYGYWTDEYSVECFNTYNASSPIYTDISVNNAVDRQWEWFLCNQPFGWWQTGAPEGTPSIVSRLVTAEYYQRQCGLYFPPVNGHVYDASHSTEATVNTYTSGWNLTIDKSIPRLLFVNGELDPWRDATVSADIRPGGRLASTAQNPVFVIPGGIHCSDLSTKNAQANAGVQAVVDAEVDQIRTWFSQFPKGGWPGWQSGRPFPPVGPPKGAPSWGPPGWNWGKKQGYW